MPLRICTYNIEWFTELFTDDNKVRTSGSTTKRGRNRPCAEALDAIKTVLASVDADILGVVEAPNQMKSGSESTTAALEAFAAFAGIRANKALIGFPSAGEQELAVLFDPQKLAVKHSPVGRKDAKLNPRFDGVFEFDTDADRIKEVYKFYRPPLEVLVNRKDTVSPSEFYLMLAHPKSKGIFSALDLVHWERENERNRRKLMAECTWIRRHVDEWLEQKHHVVVMGDMNDGPGMDFYERRFCRSAVEIIMGDLFDPDGILRSYAGKPKWGDDGWEPSTTRFEDRITGATINALIDHILVSSGLAVTNDRPYRIWNPYLDKKLAVFEPLTLGIKNALLAASDHFPVTLDLA